MDDAPDRPEDPAQHGPVRRILGTSRYLIVLAVLGTFISSAMLMVFGVLRALRMVLDLVQHPDLTDAGGKSLLVEAVSLIDIFLLGTVLYIISAGLYQLFVDDALPLPRWLHIGTLDDLKAKLTGVIVVGLLVAFLGFVVQWKGTMEIVAVGVAIGAVILAVGAYYRLTATGAQSPRYPTKARPTSGDEPPS
jgi:uncharacterized membrane protein YqhA